MFVSLTISSLSYDNNPYVISWCDAYVYYGMLEFGIPVLKPAVFSFLQYKVYYLKSTPLNSVNIEC